MVDRRTDEVALRALQLALDPVFDVTVAAAELRALARGNHLLLLAALLRFDAVLLGRWSAVAARAAEALRAARAAAAPHATAA